MEGVEVRGVAVRGPEVRAVEEGGLQSEVSDSIWGIMVLHGKHSLHCQFFNDMLQYIQCMSAVLVLDLFVLQNLSRYLGTLL